MFWKPQLSAKWTAHDLRGPLICKTHLWSSWSLFTWTHFLHPKITSLDSTRKTVYAFGIYKQWRLLLILLTTYNCDSLIHIYLYIYHLTWFSWQLYEGSYCYYLYSTMRKLTFKGWKVSRVIRQVRHTPRFEPSSFWL